MASYLDYLFPSGEYPQQAVPGLLSEEEMLKNKRAAQTAGLLNTGLGIIAASAPSRMPQGSILQPIATGIMAGQQAYQGTLADQQKMLAARAKALEPKTMSVKKGEIVYKTDPRTGKTEKFLEGAPDLPPKILEFEMAKERGLVNPNMSFEQYQTLSRTPGANISLSIGTEGAYGKAFAGKIADQDALRYDIASKAPAVLESVDRSRELLKSDKVFTGALANQKLEIAKFGQAIGATGKNTDELVANTQQLMATRAQATLDSIKASGLGSGQGFTDKDRQFLENARLGNITYSKKALEQQLEIEEKAAKGSVNAWNKRVKEISETAKEPLGVGEIELPKRETTATKRKVYNPATGKVE